MLASLIKAARRAVLARRIRSKERRAAALRIQIDTIPPQLRAMVLSREPITLRTIERELSFMRFEHATLLPPLTKDKPE